MIKPGTYDIPFDEQEARFLTWAEEALELTYGAGEDPAGPLGWVDPEEGTRPISSMLQRVSARRSRVAYLRSRSRQAVGRAERALNEAAFARENATSRATVSAAANGRQRQYASRPEVEGEAFVAAYDEHRAEAKLKRLHSIARETADVIRGCDDQLNSMAIDLRRMLEMLRFESHLDA